MREAGRWPGCTAGRSAEWGSGFHEWHRLGADMFLGPVLGTGVMVPSSGRSGRFLQSGCLPSDVHGHNVLPEGAPSRERISGLQPCDSAAAQVTADTGPERKSVLAHGNTCSGASPWVGPPRRASQRGAAKSSLASLSVHFITTWFGKIEIPVASYLASFSHLSLGAFV